MADETETHVNLLTKVAVGSGVLIGIYLLIAYGTNGGTLIKDVGDAASGYAKTLQGR